MVTIVNVRINYPASGFMIFRIIDKLNDMISRIKVNIQLTIAIT
jgi:hypothetical protein